MSKVVSFFTIFLSYHFLALSQTPEPLGSALNTEYNELNPIISPDGKTLYFGRVSHPSNNYGAKGSQDVWYSEDRGGSWTIARRMPNSINKDQYNDLLVLLQMETLFLSQEYIKMANEKMKLGFLFVSVPKQVGLNPR